MISIRANDNPLLRSLFYNNLITMIWSEFAFAAGTVIDGLLACRCLGSVPIMAAIGITSPFASLLAVFSGMLGIGCQAGCSRKLGEGKPDEASGVFSTLFALALGLTAVCMAVFWLWAGPIVKSWGATGDSAALAVPAAAYLRACVFGIPGMMLYYVLSPVLLLEGERSCVQRSTMLMIAVNVVGDLLSIFVFHGGIGGLGLSTSAANLAALAVLLAGLLRRGKIFRPALRSVRLAAVPGLLYLGLSKAVRRGCNALRPIFLNFIFSALGGAVAVSAYAVQSNLRSAFGTVSAAIAGTVLALAGVLFYERDESGMKQLYRHALRADLFIAVPAALLFIAAAPLLARLYVADSPEVAALAVTAIRCYAASLPFVVFNEIYINYFQSLGNVPAASALSALSRIGMVVPCGLAALWSGRLLWAFYALLGSEVLLSAGIFGWLALFGRGETLRERLLMLPPDFRADIADEFEIALPGPEYTLVTAPRGVYDAALRFGAGERQAVRARLLCEELLQSMTEQGFGPKNRAQLKLLRRADGLLELRLRNDGRLLDAQEWLDTHLRDRDAVQNALSLRILLFLSDSYEHRSTFRLNNVILQIRE